MQCPQCDTLLYRAHRPQWMKRFRWMRLYYCVLCKRKLFRLKWSEGD